MRSLCLWLVLVVPALGQAPTPPAPTPVKPVIIFPEEAPVVPTPPPPSAKIILPADTLYVVRSTVPCLVLASPQGILEGTMQPGPITIMAKIWPSSVSTVAKYTEPYVYLIRGKVSGTAELFVIPQGTVTAAGVTRKLIEAQLAPIPPPVPPVPPGPTPPVPPPPNPVPIPVDGFRSLIVYESSDLSKLPAGQIAALYSAQVRDYLTQKCVMGPDGKTKEWRTWDQNVSTANESKLWQDAMARPRTGLPWIVLSDGKKGFEGPLPKTEAELLTLLKSIGG